MTPTEQPCAVPSASGPVTTGTAVTVVEKPGAGVQMCLGASTMVYPPDCGGPALVGWDWSEHADGAQHEGGTRFGRYVLVGTWDGAALTVGRAVPAARAEPPAPPPSAPPSAPDAEDPAPGLDEARLVEVAEAAGVLPGASGAAVLDGRVRVDVVYDDGSLQAWCDRTWGAGVVRVVPQLHDLHRPGSN